MALRTQSNKARALRAVVWCLPWLSSVGVVGCAIDTSCEFTNSCEPPEETTATGANQTSDAGTWRDGGERWSSGWDATLPGNGGNGYAGAGGAGVFGDGGKGGEGEVRIDIDDSWNDAGSDVERDGGEAWRDAGRLDGGAAQDAGEEPFVELCESSDDCPEPAAARCNPDGSCTGCTKAADCQHFEEETLCREEDGACVACLSAQQCTRAIPVCNAAGECEGCSHHDDCRVFENTPLCEEESGSCVECTADTDCADPRASRCDQDTKRCVPCAEDEHCSGIPGAGVCDEGRCVECTGSKDDACAEGTYEYVCDSLRRVCAEPIAANEVGAASNCDSCLSDAHCEAGRLCVMQEFEGVEIGYFCFWEEGNVEQGAPANCFPGGRPYVDQIIEVDSIDGVQATTICGLRVTTCPGLVDYSSRDCDPEAPIANECGFLGSEDGLCRPIGATNRCTTRCLSDDDCHFGTECDGTPLFCRF